MLSVFSPKSWAAIFSTAIREVTIAERRTRGRLSSHDWYTKDRVVPWNHEHVRAGKRGSGHWALNVEQEGTYRITLLRWPRELGKKITQGVPAGEPVPGLIAYREEPGKALKIKSAEIKVGKFKKEKPVTADDVGITFEVELPAGKADLVCSFVLEDGKKLGSFYAEVERQ